MRRLLAMMSLATPCVLAAVSFSGCTVPPSVTNTSSAVATTSPSETPSQETFANLREQVQEKNGILLGEYVINQTTSFDVDLPDGAVQVGFFLHCGSAGPSWRFEIDNNGPQWAAAKCMNIGDTTSGSFDVVTADQGTATVTVRTTGSASLNMVVYATV